MRRVSLEAQVSLFLRFVASLFTGMPKGVLEITEKSNARVISFSVLLAANSAFRSSQR
jgi:hypothetical protein